ncbi:MAG: Gfo/Idh/MocA family oxidoreductase [Pseudomonadota bacterium]
MPEFGVGLIGCGNISTAYLSLAPMFAGFDMRAVADLHPDAAARQAQAFGLRALSVEDLLAAPNIDVVVNLTVPAAHFDVTRQILEAGKHAYSEKPLVLNLAEGEVLRDLAASKGLRIGAAPDTFLGGVHQHARALIDAGAVGQVTSGTAHVMSRGMEAWHPNPDFFFAPGAGPILDLGPYYITNLVQLLGPVRSVLAQAVTAFERRTIGSGPRAGETVPVRTPTTLHGLLTFEVGAVISLGASWDVAAHRHGHMELYGTNGTLFLPDPNYFGGTLELGTETSIETLAPLDHPFGLPNAHSTDGRANYRMAGLADLVAAIRADRPHRCGLDLALHVVEVMTALLEAAERGERVDVASTCTRPAPLSPQDAQDLLRAV